MEVLVNTKLSLLTETVDLVCAYVNRLDPALLTADKPGCIPAADVERIMEAVCGDLNRDDPKIRFYFHGYPSNVYKNGRTPLDCVASILVYSCFSSNECDLQRSRAIMQKHRLGNGESYEINSFLRGIGATPSKETRFLSDELKGLDIHDDLRLRLAVALSAFHAHVDQLCDLLEPLAQRLQPLLEPVMAQMEPWAEQWRTALRTEAGQREFFSRVSVDLVRVRVIEIGTHIFYPEISSGIWEIEEDKFYCGAGAAFTPSSYIRDDFTSEEIMGIQLLSSLDRLNMLRLMCGRMMTPKELCHETGINRGTVFRDLNNLLQAHLVSVSSSSAGKSYTTDIAQLEKTVMQLLRFVKGGNKQ